MMQSEAIADVVGNKVFVGNTGGKIGERGWPVALDVDTASRSGAPTPRTATTSATKACRIVGYSPAGIADFSR